MVSDGFDQDKKYKVVVKVTIDDEEVTMDFTGTATQAPGFTNMPPASAKAACAIAYLMIINPGNEIAQNEGLFSSLNCIFEKGTILNPNFPAATLFGNQIADVLLEAIMKAFKDAVPEQATASWAKACTPVLSGRDPLKNDHYFDFGFFAKGGQGALKGFDGFDGIGFAGAAGCMLSQDPEMMEIKDPFFVETYEYLPDSAGAGQYRGGYGTYVRIRIDGENNSVGTIGDGVENEGAPIPYGLFGGHEGSPNKLILHYPNGEKVQLGSKDLVTKVPTGTILEMVCGGGGGYGDPKFRNPEQIKQELLDGLLSPEKAKETYGITV